MSLKVFEKSMINTISKNSQSLFATAEEVKRVRDQLKNIPYVVLREPRFRVGESKKVLQNIYDNEAVCRFLGTRYIIFQFLVDSFAVYDKLEEQQYIFFKEQFVCTISLPAENDILLVQYKNDNFIVLKKIKKEWREILTFSSGLVFDDFPAYKSDVMQQAVVVGRKNAKYFSLTLTHASGNVTVSQTSSLYTFPAITHSQSIEYGPTLGFPPYQTQNFGRTFYSNLFKSLDRVKFRHVDKSKITFVSFINGFFNIHLELSSGRNLLLGKN